MFLVPRWCLSMKTFDLRPTSAPNIPVAYHLGSLFLLVSNFQYPRYPDKMNFGDLKVWKKNNRRETLARVREREQSPDVGA